MRRGGPAVIAQLRQELPGWQCTSLAVDGDVVPGVSRQLASLPSHATHPVVSAGGNEALGNAPLLQELAASVGNALALLGPPSAPGRNLIEAALCLFNDAIARAALSRRAALINLRLICSEDADYANAIEPSSQGGRKIARAIASFTAAANREAASS